MGTTAHVDTTSDYKIEVGVTVEKDATYEVYCIVNKVTGVREMESSVLPKAIEVMYEIQDHLDKQRKDHNPKPDLTIVS